MKKIMNTPETFVYDMCHGLAKAHPELEFVEKFKIVKKVEINDEKVSLISGGGSGHEPAHAGFVGKGMLDCAVCGDVFASPSQVQVYNAIKKCATDKGVLLIIKNYSGDCMNFNNAMADAQDDGIKVDAVYVNDDIAVKDSLYTVGRRGVAGTVLVHKCAGAAAEQGKELEEVKAVANKVIENVRSFGFAFTSCTVPAAGHPTFEIGDDEMEFGVGIHGEPGRFREKIDYSKGSFSDDLARRIVTDLEEDLKLKKGEEVVLLINGFGGSPLQELYILNNSVNKALEADGIRIHRTIVGNFMTSIDMAGASITVLRVDEEVPFCEADKMGDGDFGMSIAKGFKQLKADWATRKKGDIGQFLVSCSEIIKEYCGGASGPIWGSAFKYAGKAMLGKKEVNLTDLAFLFTEANRGVYETGKKSFGKGADIGDKTLVDALKPCAIALTKAAEEGKKLQAGLDLGAKAAHEGAEATKSHVATLGRAGTVGERSIGYPDAGAHGLDVIFNELAKFIKNFN